MIIYDYLWLFVIIYDYLWLFMIIITERERDIYIYIDSPVIKRDNGKSLIYIFP